MHPFRTYVLTVKGGGLPTSGAVEKCRASQLWQLGTALGNVSSSAGQRRCLVYSGVLRRIISRGDVRRVQISVSRNL
jgi:hypothetical protein